LLHQKPWKFVGFHWIDSFDQRKDPERAAVEDTAAAAAQLSELATQTSYL
jgi:hypothetical protein